MNVGRPLLPLLRLVAHSAGLPSFPSSLRYVQEAASIWIPPSPFHRRPAAGEREEKAVGEKPSLERLRLCWGREDLGGRRRERGGGSSLLGGVRGPLSPA